MPRMRLAIVGFGTVGRWLAEAIERRGALLAQDYGIAVSLVGIATRRHGFVYREDGFDIPSLLARTAAHEPLTENTGTRRWETAREGLAQAAIDVLAEASNTNPREPEPALSHIRAALERGIHVITSSKGACAAAALDLIALARRRGVEFRMESTVMSGTPVLSTLREGLAGARVIALRGILNATANHILTLMAEGLDYPAALADAQARGYAEPDPADDVDGHDIVAKARILAAVAFGRAVALDHVLRRGISGLPLDAVLGARRNEGRIKLVAEIRAASAAVRVEPVALSLSDPLARIDGAMNALCVETDTVREIMIVGPGAGPEQAGQGLFADLVAIARRW